MNILIIEDETAAARYLQELLRKVSPELRILGVQESVRNAVAWLQNNPAPELIISDIQLADGTCFEIFRSVAITTPVIFTTAYDEYIQQAFKLHSIDYLLKPIDETALLAAVTKYKSLRAHFQQYIDDKLLRILDDRPAVPPNYKTRFLIKIGDRLSTLPVDKVGFLRADGRCVFLHDIDGHKFILDESLDDLERVLDPAVFFRLNRRFIIPVTAIERIQQHFNGKLHVRLRRCDDSEIFVSREKVKAFKIWLGGN